MMPLLIGLNLVLLLAGMLLGIHLLYQSRRLAAAWRVALEAERQAGMQLATQLALLASQLDQTLQAAEPAPAPAPAGGGIEQAIRMAGEGAGAAAITRNCGLSRAEAELLVRIHGRASA